MTLPWLSDLSFDPVQPLLESGLTQPILNSADLPPRCKLVHFY